MSGNHESPGADLLRAWRRTQALPLGVRGIPVRLSVEAVWRLGPV